MGSKYTVSVYGKFEIDRGYEYHVVWEGKSLITALRELWKATRMGFGCTKLEIR